MATPLGLVRFHRDNDVLTFQVAGWGKMKQSLPMRQCAEQALAGGVKSVRVDLRQCTYLDSTFLGTLLFLHRVACRRNGRDFALVCPSADCCKQFRQMGVEGVLPSISTDDLEPAAWMELPGCREEPEDFNRNVLEAHQELANLGGKCGESFAEAARQLEQDLAKKS